jgi:NAD-dependent protein deacetylase/lipoamidase
MLVGDLAQRLGRAASVTVLTGAGVSAASGIPTFRGAAGLWKQFRPEELATPEAFARDPATVWEWYDWRRQLIAEKRPNAAHEVLAAWSRRLPGFTLVTQNVDGLHERAGTQNVVRFHGSIWEVACSSRCAGSPRSWPDERVPLPRIPPACPHCGGLLRPGVVWFGEGIDPEVAQRAAAACACDVFLVVGTSSVVYPAAGLAAEAQRLGAFTAEINPEPGAETDLSIAGRAEDVLPEVEREWMGEQIAKGE